MPSKVVVSAITFILMITFLVFIVEFFVPLSVKAEMNIICRSTLLKMEIEGGLKGVDRDDLLLRMRDKGFINVIVEGTSQSKQGGKLELRVEADYRYNKLKGLFLRSYVTQHMVYKKSTIARKVIN